MLPPPDVDAPEVNRLHRFPPQGPARVARIEAPGDCDLAAISLGLQAQPRVAHDLAEMSERWGVRGSMLFDTPINLHAMDFSRAPIDARLDLRGSDPYRVMPSREGDLALLARAGCVGITPLRYGRDSHVFTFGPPRAGSELATPPRARQEQTFAR